MDAYLANKINNIFNDAKIKIEKAIEEYEQDKINVTKRLTKSLLTTIDWKLYEKVCTKYLIIKNCNAKLTKIGADEGVDIIINDSKENPIGIAQCKKWNNKIGVNLVREFFGIMTSKNINQGIFFTTSYFTQDAIDFCKNKRIILINGDKLINEINEINKLEGIQQEKLLTIATEGNYMTPTCVNCDEKMIKRIGKKGSYTGNEFWGCINYPKCRNLINIKK